MQIIAKLQMREQEIEVQQINEKHTSAYGWFGKQATR